MKIDYHGSKNNGHVIIDLIIIILKISITNSKIKSIFVCYVESLNYDQLFLNDYG